MYWIRNLLSNSKIVVFIWLLSHVGIQGNTNVIILAAETDSHAAPHGPHTDFGQHINQYGISKCQTYGT